MHSFYIILLLLLFQSIMCNIFHFYIFYIFYSITLRYLMCNIFHFYIFYIFYSVTLRYLLPTIHGSLLVQVLSFDISGIRILVSVFWGSILSLGSPFFAFLHLQFWRLGVYGFWGGLCLPPLEIHLTVIGFLHSNLMSFWSFGFSVHF